MIGASIAGLWTARALSEHFEEVLVLERDQSPADPFIRLELLAVNQLVKPAAARFASGMFLRMMFQALRRRLPGR